MIKKSTLLLVTFLLIIVLSQTFTFSIPLKQTPEKEGVERIHPLYIQDREDEEKGGEDTYYITLLKQIREKVDGWLKSLNEKIEKEDITRLKVRFYEVIRGILEWVKGKLDRKIESLEERPKKKEKRGLFREAHQRVSGRFGKG
ncbi:MAG: hypothetical protein HXY46_00230 [Syntrophaceae bacterium]|nr:hypothetical protein [Syntrophaceae bacterium]